MVDAHPAPFSKRDIEGTIAQWGDTLALRIPKARTKQTGAKNDSTVSVSVENGRMVIQPVHRQRKDPLQELVTIITLENRQPAARQVDIQPVRWGPTRPTLRPTHPLFLSPFFCRTSSLPQFLLTR
ncbi:hypothetical protein LBMAG56_07580 [Verrucomicrobiota bacterium]|nr:hypothetical protein LBMAG56_07580 [Verrucomicrobiota bacterium]